MYTSANQKLICSMADKEHFPKGGKETRSYLCRMLPLARPSIPKRCFKKAKVQRALVAAVLKAKDDGRPKTI